MIVSITGARGFIGAHLVARCVIEGCKVRILTRGGERLGQPSSGIEVHVGDLTSEADDLVPFVAGADVLYHCAGEIQYQDRMRAVHVQGTARLLDASLSRVKRWVQLSSVGVYGVHRSGIITEDSPSRPIGTYEETKAESDRLVLQICRNTEMEVVILRPSNVFGPGMRNRSLYQLIDAIERRRFFYIGSEGASANYVPVQNVVEALWRCGSLPHAAGRVYNLSDYRTIEQVVDVISRAVGRRPPRLRVPEVAVRTLVRCVPKPARFPLTTTRIDALTSRARYPADKIMRELGYQQVVSLEDALACLVAGRRARL